ncbi:MAG: type II toxin-antitoxin system VapC family toxin [Coriobacteriales bacterium]|jgi:tRNA(fMet)-specific endonuclease VapC
MYLLDSCTCIDIMRGRLPYAYDLMRKSDPSSFKIPAIVAAELFFGAENSTRIAENRLLVERLLQPYEILPFDATCAVVYGAIRNELKRKGRTIGPNDLLIAATAMANHGILVSRNVKEFKRIPGLRLETWHDINL